MQQAMEDCMEILKSLEGRLEEVENFHKGFFAFMKNSNNLHSTERCLAELQIVIYRRSCTIISSIDDAVNLSFVSL